MCARVRCVNCTVTKPWDGCTEILVNGAGCRVEATLGLYLGWEETRKLTQRHGSPLLALDYPRTQGLGPAFKLSASPAITHVLVSWGCLFICIGDKGMAS